MTVRKPNSSETADLAAWRVLALRRMPYLASVLFKVVPLFNDETPTLAVDERWRLYVNFEWARSQTPEMVGQGLCHEASHLLGNHSHFAKQMGVTPEKHRQWNAAADAAINDDLRDAGCKELADFGVLPSKIGAPDYETPQFYYRHLDEQQDTSGGGMNGSGEGGDSCGSGSGGAPAPGELGGNGDQGNPSDDDSNGDTAGIGEAEAEIARIATAQAIKTAHGQRPGSVPGGLVDLADQIMAPTPIPWQKMLSAVIRRPVAFQRGRTTFTYKRINRRRHDQKLHRPDGSIAGRAIFPGTVAPKVKMAYLRDTSGSMSREQLSQVNAEVERIASTLGIRGGDLMIYDADTRIQDAKAYKGRQSVAEVKGRGGTDMAGSIQEIWDMPKRPAVIVCATDGETGWPTEPGPTPVIALIVTENGEKPHWCPEPPAWITTIYAEVKPAA